MLDLCKEQFLEDDQKITVVPLRVLSLLAYISFQTSPSFGPSQEGCKLLPSPGAKEAQIPSALAIVNTFEPRSSACHKLQKDQLIIQVAAELPVLAELVHQA
jgi:hypothetical protein